MCENGSYILSGPKDDSGLPHTSIGNIIFASLKEKRPDEVLIVDALTKEEITRGQLLQRSIKFATILQDLGLNKGDVIAIASENDVNYMVPVLSALYMGIIISPVNPAYTAGELKRSLLISKPKLIICSASTIETVLKVKEEVANLETVLLLRGSSTDNPAIKTIDDVLTATATDANFFKPQTLDYCGHGAFILSSSGTTGLPKGVLLTHQSLRALLVSALHPCYVGIKPGDVTILIAPYFHIFGMMTHISAVVGSMQVVVMNQFKPDLFLKCIEEHKVTLLFIIPQILNLLANSPLVDSYDTSTVSDIVCGAAPVGEDIIMKASARLGNVPVRRGYGITETGGSIAFQIPGNLKSGSVGNLVPQIIAKVCNADTQKTLGPSEIGELCFKGPSLMKMYMGNPTETKKSFDKDGFYHSGDVGFYDEDHHFYIVDRLKELIKYKGFQVSPTELEGLLLTHPGIVDCGVIGIPDERAGELALAFVVCRSGATLTEKEVVGFVADQISVQKQLHGGVRFIDEVPRNTSGKILRKNLKEIFVVLEKTLI